MRGRAVLDDLGIWVLKGQVKEVVKVFVIGCGRGFFPKQHPLTRVRHRQRSVSDRTVSDWMVCKAVLCVVSSRWLVLHLYCIFFLQLWEYLPTALLPLAAMLLAAARHRLITGQLASVVEIWLGMEIGEAGRLSVWDRASGPCQGAQGGPGA